MATNTTTATVCLPAHPNGGMWRCGRRFVAGVPQVLDLEQAELQAFQDDPMFTVQVGVDTPTTPGPDTAQAGDTGASAPGDNAAGDTGGEGDQAMPTVDELCAGNTRKELEALALAAGVPADQVKRAGNKEALAELLLRTNG